MSDEQQESGQPRRDEGATSPPIAPRWHTAALVLLIVGVAVVGSLLVGAPASPPAARGESRIGAYLAMATVPWVLTLYVARIGRAASALSALLGRSWDGAARAAIDVVCAAVCVLFVRVGERLFAKVVDAAHADAIAAVLPRSAAERAAWLLVALSAGFGEEVVYRGYLRVQLAAFTRSASFGVVAQAALFGIAHLNQGAAAAARIAVYGLAFGVVAQARRSLLPVIVAHVALDAASGWS